MSCDNDKTYEPCSCGCGGSSDCNCDCSECAPLNCIEQAIRDALATLQEQLEALVKRAEDAAKASEDAAAASAASAAEAKDYRDAAELAATTATDALKTITDVAVSLEETAKKLQEIADELATAIAGIAVVTWYYTAVSEGQTVIPVPDDKNALDVQCIYIEGARQEPGRGFVFDKTAKTITLAEGIPLGLEISIILGTYSDNPTDFPQTLASTNGASLIGTTSGQTVQQELNALKQASGNFSEALDPILSRLAAESGLPMVGTFEVGATVTTASQSVGYKAEGKLYRWAGVLPKTVAAGSTPATAGGIATDAWVRVDQSTLRDQLASNEGATLIGSGYGGTIFEDMAAKSRVFPLTNVYPSMSAQEINTILAAGGAIYFNAGNYTVTTPEETFKFSQNTQVFFHPNAKLKAGANNLTVARASALDVNSGFIRNCKIYDLRIDLTGFNNCIGLHLYSARNNSGVFDPWIDMGIGTGNTGIKIEYMSYGLIISNSEILNGGVGGKRIFVLNGPNAITLKDHRGYSGDPANKCEYGIVVFNSVDGSTDVDYITTFTTAAVCITGGFSQNTSQFGLFDSADGTNVYGMYFERNDVADISLSGGSRDFYCAGIQHSHSIGDCMYRGRGCVGAVIHAPNNGLRSRWFDFSGASQCYAYIPRARSFPAGTTIPIGNTDGLAVDRGSQSFFQYTSGTLPLDIRQGYALYYLNVTSGMNITLSGTPYNGQKINMLVRGSNIASLSFAGVPVDVTGANTTTTKTATFTATYWSSLNKWTLSMPQWSAST